MVEKTVEGGEAKAKLTYELFWNSLNRSLRKNSINKIITLYPFEHLRKEVKQAWIDCSN